MCGSCPTRPLARALCLDCLAVYCIGERSSVDAEGNLQSRHLVGHMQEHCRGGPTDGTGPFHAVCCGLADLSFYCHRCEDYLDNYRIPELKPLYGQVHLAKFGELPDG